MQMQTMNAEREAVVIVVGRVPPFGLFIVFEGEVQLLRPTAVKAPVLWHKRVGGCSVMNAARCGMSWQ